MNEPYYKAYEKRYQAAFSVGAERWGHSPDDEVLYHTLKSWVEENSLQGKRIIEYGSFMINHRPSLCYYIIILNIFQYKIKCFSPEGRKATLIIHSSSAKRLHSSLFIQNPLKINE